MFHIAAFFASIANTAAFQQIAALATAVDVTRDSNYLVNDYNKLLAVGFQAGNLTRAQVQLASMRNLAQMEVKPFQLAAPAAFQQWQYLDLRHDPLEMRISEELAMYAQQNSAGAQNAYAFAIVAAQKPQPIAGKVFTVRYTATATLAANAWTSFALTADQTLDPRTYAVVGARFKSAGALAGRIIFYNQILRPGTFAVQADTVDDADGFRFGGMGEWGRFNGLNLPQCEILSTSADTSEVVDLDLIAIG